MNREKIEELKLGLVAQECVDVDNWLTDDWQDQKKFDDDMEELNMSLRPVMIAGVSNSLIPPAMGMHNHLFALQVMMKNDLVEAKEEDGLIWYRKA